MDGIYTRNFLEQYLKNIPPINELAVLIIENDKVCYKQQLWKIPKISIKEYYYIIINWSLALYIPWIIAKINWCNKFRYTSIKNALHRIAGLKTKKHKKGALRICSKFTGKHPFQSVISTKLQRNFIEITLRYVCSPENFLFIFRMSFS